MSIAIQKQIKDNSTSVREYFTDLQNWSEELAKEENRRLVRKKAKATGAPLSSAGGPAANGVSKPLSASGGQLSKSSQQPEKPKASLMQERSDEAIKRDKTPMPQYYHDWEHFDADAEVDRIEDETFHELRQEREERQAQKDQILDEMALNGHGERSRTSMAKPRVAIQVRASGRRVSPVDLAIPKKKEANAYFKEGRYREAVALYTAGLDLLEKYEPPTAPGSAGSKDEPKEAAADCAGQETEALEIKRDLYSNRAQALVKLEEWKEAALDCSEALRYDPGHHKSILRRGFALARLKKWSAAARDLEQAVATDSDDRKAKAELQMVRRMLEQQHKEQRLRAQAVMTDPTRQPQQPTRRLAVRPMRQGEVLREEAPPAPAIARPTPADEVDAPTAAAPTHGAAAAPRQREAYVPRSVRMRGRQPAAGTAAPVSAAATNGAVGEAAAPAMNFYTFEAQWARVRSKPGGRAALLRKVGARALPTLFRESLDAELLASIVEALWGELRAEDAGESACTFAARAMEALASTQRFELSAGLFSPEERGTCEKVLCFLAEREAFSEATADALREAFLRPASSAKNAAEELDEDDIAENGRSPVAPDLDDLDDVVEESSAAEPGAGSVAAETPPGGAAPAFALDDCD